MGIQSLDDWSNIITMSLSAATTPHNTRRPAAETRERLLDVGSGLINAQGYNNTGINAIVLAAGVPKGSFYYYFASKEDFGLAVIDRFDAHYRSKLDAAFNRPRMAPLKRLRGYLENGMADMIKADFCSGCLIGNLGQELAGRHPPSAHGWTRCSAAGWTALPRAWKKRGHAAISPTTSQVRNWPSCCSRAGKARCCAPR